MKTLKIHSELQTLLPPLTDEECKGLEADIVAHGCLSPLVTWDGIIVDGHNRYEICQKHGLPFETIELTFDSLDQAKLWAWQHQEHRRNMTSYQRTALALKFKPMLAAKGKANMSSGGKGLENSPNLTKETNTRQEIAQLAGVSDNTVARVEYLEEHADEETKEKLCQGKTSINKEYKRVKEKAAKPKTTPEANEESAVDEPKASENVPCIEGLTSVVRTTLKSIRQDDPEYLICSLASHFRDGYIEDLIPKAMAFLHKEKGPKVTTSILNELIKQFKNKR